MRKNVVLIAVAAAALALLAGCSQNDLEPAVVQDTDAISFSAYTTAAITKGVAVESSEVMDEKGIGVFAFYQKSARGVNVFFNTRKFKTPDFMCNQQVTYSSSGGWTYSPMKYWSNNSGDLLSFFAYAPYESGTTWDDMGIATDASASKITASFPIYNTPMAMRDILWTDPQINKTKASTVNGSQNNPVQFNFKHILSKVAIYIGVNSNSASSTPTAWTDAATSITIDKIEFTNLAEVYRYSCPITSGAMSEGTWTVSSTTQDIALSYSGGDFADTSAVVNSTNYAAARYKNLLVKENGNDAYMFLAPQTFTDGKEQVTISYTIQTTATGNSSSSTISDSMTVDLYDFMPGGFKSGEAYNMRFLIDMDSIHVQSGVADW